VAYKNVIYVVRPTFLSIPWQADYPNCAEKRRFFRPSAEIICGILFAIAELRETIPVLAY
jgi:hypothetical protein